MVITYDANLASDCDCKVLNVPLVMKPSGVRQYVRTEGQHIKEGHQQTFKHLGKTWKHKSSVTMYPPYLQRVGPLDTRGEEIDRFDTMKAMLAHLALSHRTA
jgi:hypothetical protein